MQWLKMGRWRVWLAAAGLLLVLVFMVWMPLSATAHDGAPKVTTLATPTVDVTATMTALQEEKLRQEINQIESQTQTQNNWLYSSSTALIAASATVIVALFGIYQWAINRRDERGKELIAQERELNDRKAAQDKELKDRQEERRKEVVAQDKELRERAEERFRAAVTALGDENESVQINGAVLLRSFLHEEDKEVYGRYYTQIFDLAVAYLRLSNPARPSEDPDGIPRPQKTTDAPMPLTTLRQALTVVFRESFPLAREQHKDPQSLDASAIKLDRAYLMHADLRKSWLLRASLRDANLFNAKFSKAELSGADFRGADLRDADLSDADLAFAKLSGADLSDADLSDTALDKANLSNALLNDSNIEDALSMEETDLRGAKGLNKRQLKACEAKGAILSENTSTKSAKTRSSSSAPQQSSGAQAPSAPPAQATTPPPNTDAQH